IVSGVVQRVEPRQIVVDLGKTEGIIPISEQVRNERYRVGQRLKVFLLEVNRTNRGPRLIMSRSHPSLVRRLFELEVPEIFNGNVEIRAVAREAGHRSKVAVAAKQEGLDPVGSCVGLRGVRIQNVVNELNGERIDVIQWDDDPKLFIANALSPAQVVSVDVDEDENTAVGVVPDNQLSLAIGKEGQNARLAARISGWRIDIKSVSAVEAEKAVAEAERVLVAEGEEAVPTKAKKKAMKVVAEADRAQYEMPLEQLGLSGRTFNLLISSNINRIGEILEKSDQELLDIKGFGKKSLLEVKERLEQLDITLAKVIEEVELPAVEVEVTAEEIPELIAEEEEAVGEIEEIVAEEMEEEVDLIPYEAPPEEEVAAEKPQLRFAEDIFGDRAVAASTEGGRKGKKKKVSREERLEAATKPKKGRKTVDVGMDEEYDDFSED
ncbi:MAG: transcription termination factor NusA, partial [Dehalococcoidia bacterium]